MLTAAEITRSVYGAWRLAHADPGGMQFFDTTIDGFWRSFRVALLTLPAYLLLLWIERGSTTAAEIGAPAAGSWIEIAAIDLIAYAISWLAYPLAVYYLAETLDREREYFGYIVAFNWSAVLQVAAFVPVAAITGLSLLPPPLDVLLHFAVVAALLAYSWFIAKTALRIGGLAAGGLVALDVLIGLLISGISDAMIR